MIAVKSHLEVVKLEENSSLKEIGQGAFDSCTSLTSIVIPALVNCIKYYAFKECRNLKEVKIESIEIKIEKYAFELCEELHSVSFSCEKSSAVCHEYAFPKCANIVFANTPQ